jgi:hypothetical protein
MLKYSLSPGIASGNHMPHCRSFHLLFFYYHNTVDHLLFFGNLTPFLVAVIAVIAQFSYLHGNWKKEFIKNNHY